MMSQPFTSPHGPLRRKDREIRLRSEIDEILGASQVLHLALADGNIPFVVPVFYAYDGTDLYFHSAQAGSKVEIMKRNPIVCFEVSIDHGVIPDEAPCDFEARHRTVIGLAHAEFIADERDKAVALQKIVRRFTDRVFEFPPESLQRTLVVRLVIDSMKGKKHGF